MSGVTSTWRGPQVSAAMRSAAVEGLRSAAEELATMASNVAPFESGDLSKDYATPIDEDKLEAAVTFGLGPAVAYARRQHEELDYHHDEGKRSKYLEGPMNENEDKLRRMMAAPIKRKLGG